MSVNISASLAIDGWMQEPELIWLAEQASCHKLIVEVGSYKGRSTRALGDNVAVGGQVIAIDTWVGPLNTLDRDPIPSFEDEFRQNLADLIAFGTVLPCKPDFLPDSIQAWPSFWQPDMTFIDADHVYDSVRKDIETWLPKVARGGLICGHDFGYEDVSRAVLEAIPDAKCAENTSIWYSFR